MLYECQSGFTALWQTGDGDSADFGQWILREMKNMADHCFPRGYTPDIHIVPMSVRQADLDTLEVEALLCHT